MSKINAWEDEEIKTLFKFVEIKKSEGVPLIKIFDEFAKKVSRCQKSVRNYYYQEIKNLQDDRQRLKRLGISLENHIAKKSQGFSAEETNLVVNKINNLINNGYSVRKACLTLADGNINKMVRFQNKYRAELKRNNYNKSLHQKSDYSVEETLKTTNIIRLPQKRNVMTDDDIKALFMGIVKLIKKQSMESAKNIIENELMASNLKLKKALNEIILKSAEIEKLQAQIVLLKRQTEDKNQKDIEKRVKFVNIGNANKSLKSFIDGKKKEQKLIDILN